MAELGAGPAVPYPCLSCSITEDPSSDLSPLPSSQSSLKFSLRYRREQCELLVSGLEVRGRPRRRRTDSRPPRIAVGAFCFLYFTIF